MPEASSKAEYLVGVDLGGTKILAGVFTSSLKCVGRSKMSTKAERGPDAVIERIAHCVQDAVDECDFDLKQVRGVGIGAPGSVDPDSGKVMFAGNLGWKSNWICPFFWETIAISAPSACTKKSWRENRATWWASFWARASAAG
jgi:ROK family